MLTLVGAGARAQVAPGDIDDVVSLGLSAGSLGSALEPGDDFGSAVAALGDLDGNGVVDFAVGASGDDDGGPQFGALYVLFANVDGSLAGSQKISATAGGFSGSLTNNGFFGYALCSPGDLDGDGVPELAVGQPRDTTAGPKHGAVWILFLNSDGTVREEVQITEGLAGFGGDLANADEFGRAVAAPGDLDGDGVPDLVVGAINNDDLKPQSGALWALLLNADGTVKAESRIGNLSGGFPGLLDNNDQFGRAVAVLGDLDGNGVDDLAVAAPNDDDGGRDLGAIWILLMAADGTVASTSKLSATSVPALAGLQSGDDFGLALGAAGDLDGNGVVDLLVGAPGDDTGGADRGAVYLLFLDAAGQVIDSLVYAWTPDGPFADLADGAGLGTSVGTGGDIDLNGAPDLLLGDAAGNLTVVLLENPFASDPYVPAADVTAGRPGRSALVPQDADAPGYQDFIDEPVVVVPNRTTDSLTLRVGVNNSGEQLEFPPEQEVPVGQSPIDSSAGSFVDNPSLVGALADVIVANHGGDSISFLAGLPDGSLAPHVEISLLPENSAPVALANADFDGDGKLDVAVAGAQGVSVLLGDGLGGFPTSRFTPLALLTDLAVADLDGDGVPDLVATSGRAVTPALPFEEGGATALLGLGDGSFSVSASFATGTAQASVLLGDVDGDGSADALLAAHAFAAGPGGQPQATLALWSGDGAGGFAPSAAFGGHVSTSAQGIHPTFGALGDLDGDGWLDAVYTSNDSIAYPLGTFDAEQPPVVLTVLRNDGLGGFAVSEVGTAYTGKGVAPLLADVFVDDAGLPDAILVWYEDSDAGLGGPGAADEGVNTFVTAFSADGQAGFFDPTANQFSVGDEPGDGRLADVDTGGTGRLDIAVPNLRDGSVTLLLGNGDGGIRSALTLDDVGPYSVDDLPQGDWLGGPRAVELADVDGDGLGDLIVYSAWTDLSPLAPLPDVFASLTLIDYASAMPVQQLLLPRGGELLVDDVTGDGRPDAVVSQRLGPGGIEGLLIYRGLASGLFAVAPLAVPAPAGWSLAGGLASADLTGDGRSEIASVLRDAAGGTSRLFVVDLAGGSVQTSTSPLGPDLGPVRSLVLADLDGDGDADAAAGTQGGALLLGLGQGGTAFSPAPLDPLSALGGGGALAVGDVDGDGRPDLVVSTAADDSDIDQATVRILLNQGAGQFQVQDVAALQSSGVLGALRPLLGDMNGDTVLDLVLVHGTADSVSILLNQLSRFDRFGAGKAGSGGFTPSLDGSGFTTPGATFALELKGTLGGSQGLLLIGLGQLESGPVLIPTVLLQLPLALGGAAGAPGQGGANLPLTIPALPALVGLELSFQALVLDPGAGAPAPAKLSASNGLSMTVVQ